MYHCQRSDIPTKTAKYKKRRSARVKQVSKQKIAVTPVVRTTYTPMITEQLSAHKYAVGGIIVFHGRN